MYYRQPSLLPPAQTVVDLAEGSAKLGTMPSAVVPADIGAGRILHPRAGSQFRYVDLFAGIGGFHAMLDHAGGQCVFVSEIDAAARETYLRNWVDPLPEDRRPRVNVDITTATPPRGRVDVPQHDVLAAGFPCQPFSKSGFQRGMDEARGTLFWNIARILQVRRPKVVLLENVRNIAGPRHTHEWDVIIETLRSLGYRVSRTPSVFSPHLLPPERGGTPQIRDRVFILGTYVGRGRSRVEVPPTVVRGPVDGWNPALWDADWILDDDSSIARLPSFRLTASETAWIDAWDDLIQRMWTLKGLRMPGFPLWADDWVPTRALDRDHLSRLPAWKRGHVAKNAAFYDEHRDIIDPWRKDHPEFTGFPETRRKLEWQAQDTASLWETIMHFRPSGIRAKAPTYYPALVAITQTSIIGRRRRRLTPHEASRLQGLPRSFSFVGQRDQASYKQVGNGVAVGAAWHVFREHVLHDAADLPATLVAAVSAAGLNPLRDSLSTAAYDRPAPAGVDLQSWTAAG